MAQVNTHLNIDSAWVGETLSNAPGTATVQLHTRPEMCADARGLIHGGFTFGLADYAAMVAVNDPNVVLGAADVKFLAPTKLGETMIATANVINEKGKKRQVKVVVESSKVVFEGIFTCFVLDKHVLDG